MTLPLGGAAAVSAAFLASLVEALEAFTIVLAAAAVRGWRVAALGAAAALALVALIVVVAGPLLERLPIAWLRLVIVIGLALRRPLERLPENPLKFAVGVMLSAFGVFWTGEGLGVAWPLGDLAIVVLGALFLGVALLAVLALKRPSRITS